MSRSRFHVVPHDGQWRVVRVGELFKGPYRTKAEAISVAQLLALLAGPSQVIVHGAAGAVEAETSYQPG
jgi:hypothetical protein